MSSNLHFTAPSLALSFAAFALLGCTDSLSRYEDFGERLVDAGAVVDEPDAEALEELPDVNGTFLLGLAAVIAPDPPFQFLAELELDGRAVTISLTGLGRYDRMPVEGDPLVAENVPVDATGQFEANFQGEIPGDANVITGSTLTVDVTLIGRLQSPDMFCGEATGMILEPIELDIAGSTVGALRVEPGVVGEALPTPMADCPPAE